MEMLVVLGLFVVLAILGPVIGADSRSREGGHPPNPTASSSPTRSASLISPAETPTQQRLSGHR